MSEAFDPYHKWLGIPPAEQPPNRYRLLGIELFEDDPDVIENAADQRMAHLRSFSTGKNAAVAQRLLNDLAAAKVALLDPAEKAAYDEKIRSKQQKQARRRNENASAAEPPVALQPIAPPPTATPAPPAVPPEPSVPPVADPQPVEPFGGAASSVPTRTRVRKMARSRKQQSSLQTQIAIGLGILFVLVVAFAALTSSTPEQEEQSEAKDSGSGEYRPARESGSRGTTKPKNRRPQMKEKDPSGLPLPPREQRPRFNSKTEPGEEPEKEEPDDGEPLPKLKFPGEGERSDPGEDEPESEEFPTESGKKKAPPPSRAAREDIAQRIKRNFSTRDARSPEEKRQLASRLQKAAFETNDPDQRYVLWDEVRKLAVEVGDVSLAMESVRRLAQDFQVDQLELAGDVLSQIRTEQESVHESLAQTAAQWMKTAADANRYQLAVELAEVTFRSAKLSNNAELMKQSAAAERDYQSMQRKYEAVEAALSRLASNPDDGPSNLAVGKFFCFEKRDWSRGLPYLAESSDEELAQVAALDLEQPSSPEAQAALADRWSELARRARSAEAERAAMQERARRWYEAALPGLEPIEKARVEQQLRQLKQEQAGV